MLLKHIIPSKTRLKILALFYHSPQEQHYLREIVRLVGEEVNAVKRELDILDNEKLLNKERRLNKVFYSLNKHYILYEEFMRIFAKSDSLGEMIYKNMSKLGKLKYIALSMKYAKRQPIKEDEVYLLVVGTVVVPEISAIISEIEKEFGREINYTVMTDDEFTFRKKNNDPFLWRFLRCPKVMLVGSEDDLVK
jgi:DNA-binding transcriptional ArsR family regulator